MSAAPEIARLAVRRVPAPSSGTADGTAGDGTASGGPTIGVLARELRLLACHPHRWWGLVRWNNCRSEKIDLEFKGLPCSAWLVVLAPGDPGRYCDCDVMTLVAGDAMEESVTVVGAVTTRLQPGRIRVHGQGQVHQIRAGGTGFAVTLHVRGPA
jgi:hypothetical protein